MQIEALTTLRSGDRARVPAHSAVNIHAREAPVLQLNSAVVGCDGRFVTVSGIQAVRKELWE